MALKYKRVLLKLSGEALMGKSDEGYEPLSPAILAQYAKEVKTIVDAGAELAIVIGGGNIYRGMNEAETGIERAHGDYMGMLATVINGMALQAALEKAGVYTRLQSAIKMEQIAEPYIRRRAMRHVEKGRVVIFGAGDRQSLFYYRYCRFIACYRNKSRSYIERNTCRRHLYGRPGKRS
ncbi:MAG: hypothetical protein QM726_03440 [Chitinophagaceae bacterium]